MDDPLREVGWVGRPPLVRELGRCEHPEGGVGAVGVVLGVPVADEDLGFEEREVGGADGLQGLRPLTGPSTPPNRSYDRLSFGEPGRSAAAFEAAQASTSTGTPRQARVNTSAPASRPAFIPG